MFRLRLPVRATHSAAVYRPLQFADVVALGYAAVSSLRPVPCSNQHYTGDHVHLRGIAQRFAGVDCTLGYGSGVFDQEGYAKRAKPQIDMIHVVNNADAFHSANLQRYGGHYSGLKYAGGVATILAVQLWGGGVYFNPYVAMKSGGATHLVKYGVATMETCLRDLCQWDTLYLAGRMQKPVRYLQQTDSRVEFANQYNLHSALTLALLLAPSRFDETYLYETIALISYMGDPRMAMGGENPKKVQNIVRKQFKLFRQLYAPLLTYMLERRTIGCRSDLGENPAQFESDMTTDLVAHLATQLPLSFRLRLGVNSPGTALVFASDNRRRNRLVSAVRQTVSRPAAIQTLKGVLTAGIVKSVKYAWEKNSKWRA